MAIKIERDGSVEVSAVDADSRSCQPLEDLGARQAEGIAEAHRDDRELRMGRRE